MTATTDRISPLKTDEYCLTMPQFYWTYARNERVTFELAVRSLPAGYGYGIFAGLESVLSYLEQLRFTDEDIAFMAGQLQDPHRPEFGPLYQPAFLKYLRGVRFTGEVYAMAEGTAFFAGEPVVRVTAHRIEAALIEPMLIKLVNRQTSVATKAARIVDAADGRPVWDFSLRRDPGDPLETARAAYIGGVAGAAIPEAALVHHILSTGTMAHQLIQMYGEEREQQAFIDWLRLYPGRGVLLVDTYNTRRGIRRAIDASQETGIPIKAVRIDSGDLIADCAYARQALDDAGMTGTLIMPTGDLDEHRILEMLAAEAPFEVTAAGTKLANCAHLGGTYKLTAQDVDDQPLVMKKAAGKTSDPGRHQVFRTAQGDTIAMADELVDGTALLRRVMAAGGRTQAPEDLDVIRARARASVTALPAEVRAVDAAAGAWPVRRSQKLIDTRAALGDFTYATEAVLA